MKLSFSMIAMLCLMGCAPHTRLSFPTHALETRGGWEWFDVNHDGRGDFAVDADHVGYDDDQDGALDRVYRLSDYQNESVPHLIIMLDSIPFHSIADRYARGDFRFFPPPQKIIPIFPTLTEISYTNFLHAPPLPGMIDDFYDHQTNKMNSGLWHRFSGNEEPWEQRLAYHAKFWEGGLTYLNPRGWFPAEMARVRDAIDRSPDRMTLVYVISASGMMSKYGADAIDEMFDQVRQLCLQLLYERQGALKISVMADHGHNLSPSKNVHLPEILKAAGFRPTDQLRDANDVVMELDGLLTYAGVITAQPAKVSDVLVRREEIEFAMYLEGDRVIVRNDKGSAAIDCRDGKVRYRPVDADVLKYQPVLDALKTNDFVSDDDWFRATLDHEYPDAPRRIWDAFHGTCVNPPTIILTLKDGYCAGDPSFEKFITMKSTHGGLNQANSATFIMSMTGRIDSPMRMKDVLQKLEPGFRPRVMR